ncbi:zinc-ribbon domain-containing protein [Amycolatopsis minnesotensis]|uniref:Zinc-ribbon 15 domain-containing protein n=1 Tax=Amycolatopsis minnesotensis TaxID=337894 RepID=A0ABN2SMY4_9PSEU
MIIYGWRTKVHDRGTATLVCAQCQNPAAHVVRNAVKKFTLFWIPLFPIGSKWFTQCTFCGAANKTTKAEAQQVMNTAQGGQPPQATQQLAPQQQYQHQPQAQHPPRQQFPQGGQFAPPQQGQPPYPPQQGYPQQQYPPHPGR